MKELTLGIVQVATEIGQVETNFATIAKQIESVARRGVGGSLARNVEYRIYDGTRPTYLS